MKYLSQTLQQVDQVTPIFSVHGRHKAFLEIVQQGNRVRVQPTPLGRSTLNRFWPMWLRELILTKTDHQHGFAVELYRGNVVISSETTMDGLRETTRSLAADIRPLMGMPLKRWNNRNNPNPDPYGPIEWLINRPGIPTALIIDAIPLPRYANVKFRDWSWHWRHSDDDYGMVRLAYGGGALSSREVAMIVELHFALACCT